MIWRAHGTNLQLLCVKYKGNMLVLVLLRDFDKALNLDQVHCTYHCICTYRLYLSWGCSSQVQVFQKWFRYDNYVSTYKPPYLATHTMWSSTICKSRKFHPSQFWRVQRAHEGWRLGPSDLMSSWCVFCASHLCWSCQHWYVEVCMQEKSHAFMLNSAWVYHLNESIIPQKLPCLLEVGCSGNLRKASIIGVVQKLCNWWRLKANVSKCAVVQWCFK